MAASGPWRSGSVGTPIVASLAPSEADQALRERPAFVHRHLQALQPVVARGVGQAQPAAGEVDGLAGSKQVVAWRGELQGIEHAVVFGEEVGGDGLATQDGAAGRDGAFFEE